MAPAGFIHASAGAQQRKEDVTTGLQPTADKAETFKDNF